VLFLSATCREFYAAKPPVNPRPWLISLDQDDVFGAGSLMNEPWRQLHPLSWPYKTSLLDFYQRWGLVKGLIVDCDTQIRGMRHAQLLENYGRYRKMNASHAADLVIVELCRRRLELPSPMAGNISRDAYTKAVQLFFITSDAEGFRPLYAHRDGSTSVAASRSGNISMMREFVGIIDPDIVAEKPDVFLNFISDMPESDLRKIVRATSYDETLDFITDIVQNMSSGLINKIFTRVISGELELFLKVLARGPTNVIKASKRMPDNRIMWLNMKGYYKGHIDEVFLQSATTRWYLIPYLEHPLETMQAVEEMDDEYSGITIEVIRSYHP